jgi:adenylate kinase
VGKSTVAEILKRRGYTVLSVNELAERFDCIIGEDDGCKIVDVEELSEVLKDNLPEGLVFLEGHLSHLLDPDVIVVLRCNPIELKRRLERRNWDESKILENVEAEIVDVILVEALDTGRDVYEIDTTDRRVEDTVAEAYRAIVGKLSRCCIDWTQVLSEDELMEVLRYIEAYNP